MKFRCADTIGYEDDTPNLFNLFIKLLVKIISGFASAR